MDTSSSSKRRVLGELNPNASPLFSSHRNTNIKSQQRLREARITMSPQKPQKQLGSPVKLRPFKTETDLESAASRVPDDDDSLGDSDQEPARKRSRLGSDAEGDKVSSYGMGDSDNRQRSTSPDRSSVFDNSALDDSQATNMTEPDGDHLLAVPAAPAPRPPPRRFTHQEARDRAETLRLRLALANYKVRTGQTHLPLDRLQQLPVQVDAGGPLGGRVGPFVGVFGPSRGPDITVGVRNAGTNNSSVSQRTSLAAQPFPVRDARNELLGRRPMASGLVGQQQTQEGEEEEGAGDDGAGLPELPPARGLDGAGPVPNTPERRRGEDDERLSSSALRGGAASGLVRLSRS